MELVPVCEPESGAAIRSPRPARAPLGPVERRLARAMNASEQMYFFGAPLAHVVDYEDRLRSSRCEKSIRDVARSCRALQLHPNAVLPPLVGATRQSEGANDA